MKRLLISILAMVFALLFAASGAMASWVTEIAPGQANLGFDGSISGPSASNPNITVSYSSSNDTPMYSYSGGSGSTYSSGGGTSSNGVRSGFSSYDLFNPDLPIGAVSSIGTNFVDKMLNNAKSPFTSVSSNFSTIFTFGTYISGSSSISFNKFDGGGYINSGSDFASVPTSQTFTGLNRAFGNIDLPSGTTVQVEFDVPSMGTGATVNYQANFINNQGNTIASVKSYDGKTTASIEATMGKDGHVYAVTDAGKIDVQLTNRYGNGLEISGVSEGGKVTMIFDEKGELFKINGEQVDRVKISGASTTLSSEPSQSQAQSHARMTLDEKRVEVKSYPGKRANDDTGTSGDENALEVVGSTPGGTPTDQQKLQEATGEVAKDETGKEISNGFQVTEVEVAGQTNTKDVSLASPAFQSSAIIQRGLLDPSTKPQEKADYLNELNVQDSASIIAGMASKDLTQTIGVVSAMDSNSAASALAYIHNYYDTNKGIPLTTQILGTGMQLDTAHDILCCMNTKDAKEILEEIGRFIPGHEFSIATGIVQVYQDPYTGVYNGLHNSNFNPKIQDNEGLVKLLSDEETSPDVGIFSDTRNFEGGVSTEETGKKITNSFGVAEIKDFTRTGVQNSQGIDVTVIHATEMAVANFENPQKIMGLFNEDADAIVNTDLGMFSPIVSNGDRTFVFDSTGLPGKSIDESGHVNYGYGYKVLMQDQVTGAYSVVCLGAVSDKSVNGEPSKMDIFVDEMNKKYAIDITAADVHNPIVLTEAGITIDHVYDLLSGTADISELYKTSSGSMTYTPATYEMDYPPHCCERDLTFLTGFGASTSEKMNAARASGVTDMWELFARKDLFMGEILTSRFMGGRISADGVTEAYIDAFNGKILATLGEIHERIESGKGGYIDPTPTVGRDLHIANSNVVW